MAKAQLKPKAQDLPGMEDRAIKALDTLAEDYADIRDRRQALTTEEVALKGQILEEMHRLDRTHYRRNGVEITIEPGEESIKVKVKKADADAEEEEVVNE